MKASTLSSTNNLTIFPIVVLLSHPESNDTKLATQSHRNAFCLNCDSMHALVFLIVRTVISVLSLFFVKLFS